MIVEALRTTYFCTECQKKSRVVDIEHEFPMADLHKYIGITQCMSCKSIGTLHVTHMKCRIAECAKQLVTFDYTMRCNICNTSWPETAEFTGKLDLLQKRRHIEAKSHCANLPCSSHNFTMVNHSARSN